MSAPVRHLSTHSDRLKAAQVASRMLISRREIDRDTRLVLEEIAFQRDARIDVLDWVTSLEQRYGGGHRK